MPLYNGQLTSVSLDETKRYAGIRANQNFPETIIKDACLEAQLLTKPQGVYTIFSYDERSQLIDSPAPLRLTGKSIVKHLMNCQKVALMAVTIGPDVEANITKHFTDGNYTAGLLLDAAATAAVEGLADQINNLINSLATKSGYTTTWRFSPGYGDWDISVQQALLTALNTTVINLTTTESMMLTPRKSITAVIGFKPYEAACQHKSQPKNCESCSQSACIARKEKTK